MLEAHTETLFRADFSEDLIGPVSGQLNVLTLASIRVEDDASTEEFKRRAARGTDQFKTCTEIVFLRDRPAYRLLQSVHVLRSPVRRAIVPGRSRVRRNRKHENENGARRERANHCGKRRTA